MSLEEIRLPNGATLGARVSQSYEVYDLQAARMLDHLLGHLGLLLRLADGVHAPELAELLERYPQYGVSPDNYQAPETREASAQVASQECQVLLRYITRVALAGTPQEKQAAVEEFRWYHGAMFGDYDALGPRA